MTWLNACIFLLLAVGHAEVQVALLNRLYALRIGSRMMDLLGGVHYLLLFGVPPVLVWFAGFRGPRLLDGGTWSDVAIMWWIVFATCGAGLLSLLVCTLRWQLPRDAVELESCESEIVDIAQRLGHPPIGDGGHPRTIKFPRNEVFQLDVCTKTLRHPRLPAAWDGLTILHLSDFHFEGTIDIAYFEEAIRIGRDLKPHLVVFTGDLLDREELIGWLPRTLGAIDAPLGKIFVLGNHDWYLKPDQVRKALVESGWIDATTAIARIPGQQLANALGNEPADVTLTIVGDERPWMGGASQLDPSRDDEFRLLLSHSPDSLSWAKRHGVDLMLAGHNHGGQIVLPIIGPVYSPSLHGVKYAAGTFYESPTLLHVSRGLGAQQPIRINCRPELALLRMRAET